VTWLTRIAVALPIFLLANPECGLAQFRFIPQAGLFAPVSDLGEVDTGAEAWDVGTRESSLAYGLGVEMGNRGGVSLRLTGLYGSDSEVPIDGVGCSGSDCTLRSTLLAGSAALVLRLIPPLAVVQPYFVLGAGFKRYNFDFATESYRDLFSDRSKATGQLGLGLDWNFGSLGMQFEVSDFVSGAVFDDGTAQHDFILTLGLVIGT